MIRVILFLPLVFILQSCATCWRGGEPLRDVEMRSLKAAAADLRSVQGIKVYHGLAHPKRDKEIFAKQMATVPHVEFEGFQFHKAPEQVSGTTVKQVVDLYCDPESHQALATDKTTCAGFHPDYALVWSRGGKQRVLHICYGCHEWKYFGPGGVVHTDINEPAYFDKITRWLPAKP